MARHLKLAVEDFVYWGVVAIAAERGTSQAQVFNELISEALRARALGTPVVQPPTAMDDTITRAAGLEAIAVEDMRIKLISLGWWCYVADLEEAARPEAGA